MLCEGLEEESGFRVVRDLQFRNVIFSRDRILSKSGVLKHAQEHLFGEEDEVINLCKILLQSSWLCFPWNLNAAILLEKIIETDPNGKIEDVRMKCTRLSYN